MSRPTNSPCALPTFVGHAAANEEPRPSPGRPQNTRPPPIAKDGEGGIPFVQRLVAERDPARAGEVTHTEAVLPINHQPQSTSLEPHIPVNLNPMTTFLPSGIPIHDPLVFASRLAQYYSEPQGQDPIMTNTANTAAAGVVTRHETA